MDQRELTQSFIERCQHAGSIGELAAAFQTTIERLGFVRFACCSHTDPLNPAPGAVVIHNYPVEWVERFSGAGLQRIDPVMQYADHAPLPFCWSAPEFRAGLTGEQKGILAAASAYGLGRGYTIPISLTWTHGTLRASCSLVPDRGAVATASYLAAPLLATYLYAAASRLCMPAFWRRMTPVELTPHERAVLGFVAHGKSDWVIGRLLGGSEGAVHKCIQRVMRRMGATSRTQAVISALMARQISFGDVAQCEPQQSGRCERGSRMRSSCSS